MYFFQITLIVVTWINYTWLSTCYTLNKHTIKQIYDDFIWFSHMTKTNMGLCLTKKTQVSDQEKHGLMSDQENTGFWPRKHGFISDQENKGSCLVRNLLKVRHVWQQNKKPVWWSRKGGGGLLSHISKYFRWIHISPDTWP